MYGVLLISVGIYYKPSSKIFLYSHPMDGFNEALNPIDKIKAKGIYN
jgi:hypothetical protein